MLISLLTLVVAAIISGAAVYITIAEQRARLLFEDRALLAEWHPAYKHSLGFAATLVFLWAALCRSNGTM